MQKCEKTYKNYELIDEIGHGAHGKVSLVRNIYTQ